MNKTKCNVQCKIKCIFDVEVTNKGGTSKRPGQSYAVTATERISPDVQPCDVLLSNATEKIDGTCCLIAPYEEKLHLWARLDRKLKKHAQKKLKVANQRQRPLNSCTSNQLTFNYPEDMKPVPDEWLPAEKTGRDSKTNDVIPDANGHVLGWVPSVIDRKQYCWHNSVVDEDLQMVVILQPSSIYVEYSDRLSDLTLSIESMSKFNGRTLELIGTNINGNPYCLGSKRTPFHVLVAHGNITVENLPDAIDYQKLKGWFINENSEIPFGNVEGIVWHCDNGKMFKLHRHHMKLPWPIKHPQADEELPSDSIHQFPALCRRLVTVRSDLLQKVDDCQLSPLFSYIKSIHLRTFDNLEELASAAERAVD